MSDPEFGCSLVVVLGVEGHGFLSQNHMIQSHGGLQEHVDPDLVCKTKELQKHRLHSVQTQ